MSLHVRGARVKFGGVVALDGVDLSLDPGQVLALVGPNGSGKSTLFNSVTGFVPLANGTVTVDGTDLTRLRPDQRMRRGIARTFQTPRIDEEVRVLTAVMCGDLGSAQSSLAHSLLGLPSVRRKETATRAKALDLLEAFGLRDVADRPMGELPLGKIRMVDVVRAMASDPKYLLLDEPAAGLSETEQDLLLAGIRRVASSGVGVLLVEHNFQLVKGIADRLVVLQKGEIVAEGAPDAVAADERVIEAYLGASVEDIGLDSAPAPTKDAEVLFSCEEFDVSYGKAQICHDVALTVKRGALTALLGPNGAGKSSLLAALAGIRLDHRRWDGEATLHGKRIDDLSAAARTQAGLAFVPESRGNIFPDLTVAENLELGLRRASTDERQETEALIDEIFPALEPLSGAKAGLLSGGEQQMVAIAIALASRPSVLIMDEPSQGLAPAVLKVLVDAFSKLQARGLAILLAEQNQAFAGSVALDYYVLARGRIVAHGHASELHDRREEIAAAYL